MFEKVKQLIENSTEVLSIKQISEQTGIPRTTVKRYCDKLGYNPSRHEVWNKGQTKDQNMSLKQLSLKMKGRIKRPVPMEIKNKISKSMKQNPSAGGFRNKAGRGQKHLYKGFTFYTDYAFGIAKTLDREEIMWEQPKNPICNHHFEFYLPEYELYLIVKETITNEYRVKFQTLKNKGVKFIVIDSFVYRRIKYLGIKSMLEQFKNLQ